MNNLMNYIKAIAPNLTKQDAHYVEQFIGDIIEKAKEDSYQKGWSAGRIVGSKEGYTQSSIDSNNTVITHDN